MTKPHLLITGASGFIGHALAEHCAKKGFSLTLPLRNPNAVNLENATIIKPTLPNLSSSTDWTPMLYGVDTVVHLAARVHQMSDTNNSATLQKYLETNAKATQHLLEQAKSAGVKRFIFISTIKVLGEKTTNQPFDDNTPPNPQDPYAISKYEAEKYVQNSGLDYCILRIPLVYAPNAKGNLEKLAHLIKKGIPLPFKSVRNKRSLISRIHLIDIIEHFINQATPINKTHVIADNAGISLPELLQKIADDHQLHLKLLPCPSWVLSLLLTITGKRDLKERLLGSLSIRSDIRYK